MAAPTIDSQLVDAAGWHGSDDDVRALLARGADVNSRSGSGSLVFAAAANRLSTVEILVAAGARIDGFDYPTNSPLIHAVSVPVAAYLLARGARVDASGDRGDALHHVIDRGDDVDHARLLLDHGLQPIRYTASAASAASAASIPAHARASHLEVACRRDRGAIAALLLDRGGSVDEVARDRTPVVELALVLRASSAALVLLERGAAVAPKHLELACRAQPAAVVAVVVGRTTGDATEAAARAAERGDVELLRIVIESDRVARLDHALRAAARVAQAGAVEFLLRCGADPLLRDAEQCSAVHAAARGGSIAILDRFIAAGCPVDADALGRTALHHAAAGGVDAMLRELVARGLDLEARDHAGLTPLASCAADFSTSSYDTLVALGADPIPASTIRQAALDERAEIERMFR